MNIDNDYDYNKLKNLIFQHTFDELSEIINYYIDKTKEYNVKNMYNCHLSNTINILFLKINNKLF